MADERNKVDLTTAEGMLVFALHYGERVRETFNAGGDMPPLVGLVATFDPKAGRSFPQPSGIIVMMPNLAYGKTFPEVVANKEAGATYLRSLVKASKAIGVATAMEVWHSKDPKYRYRDFSEDPNATESIMLLAEHVRFKHPIIRHAKITRNALGRGNAAPFIDPYAGGVVRMAGRFTDLLERGRFA